MINGRVQVQKAIYEKLTKEPGNGFLNSISSNLEKYFEKFVEREMIRESFFGYYQARGLHIRYVKKEIKVAMEFVVQHLEMLRLFCEGHYLKMQEYLKFQQSRGITKQNQVDLLDQAYSFLKRYYRIMNFDNVSLGQKILDFYVEVLQGPCKSNQLEVAKSKLPDILEEIYTSLVY